MRRPFRYHQDIPCISCNQEFDKVAAVRDGALHMVGCWDGDYWHRGKLV